LTRANCANLEWTTSSASFQLMPNVFLKLEVPVSTETGPCSLEDLNEGNGSASHDVELGESVQRTALHRSLSTS
jgi:hypothetical protein